MITQQNSNLAESVVRKPGAFKSVIKSINVSDPGKTDKVYAIVTLVLTGGEDIDDSDIGKDVKFFLSLKIDALPADLEALDSETQEKLQRKFSAQKMGLQTTYNFYRAARAYEFFDEKGNIRQDNISFDEQTLVNRKLDIIVKNRNGSAEASAFPVIMEDFITDVTDYYAKGGAKAPKKVVAPSGIDDPFSED
jgi:hypothetical protein